MKQKGVDIISVDASGGRHRAIKLNKLGMSLVENDRHVLAFEKFQKAVEADETYGPAYNNLGLVYFNRGNLYQAALSFDAAAQFMPENPMVLYNLGMVMEAAGKFVEAIEYYAQANDMDPTNAMFLGNLVRARIRTGENNMHVRQQLQQLAVIETRKDWVDWIDKTLALDVNPWLDRGPKSPELSDLSSDDADDAKKSEEPTTQNLPAGIQLAPGEILLHTEEIPVPQAKAAEMIGPAGGAKPMQMQRAAPRAVVTELDPQEISLPAPQAPSVSQAPSVQPSP